MPFVPFGVPLGSVTRAVRAVWRSARVRDPCRSCRLAFRTGPRPVPFVPFFVPFVPFVPFFTVGIVQLGHPGYNIGLCVGSRLPATGCRSERRLETANCPAGRTYSRAVARRGEMVTTLARGARVADLHGDKDMAIIEERRG